MKHTRICIIGGSGFVGGHLTAMLVGRGHRVTILSRRPVVNADLRVLPRVRLRQLDVYDPGVLEETFAEQDAVINLVGILNEARHSGAGFRMAHADMTQGVLDAMQNAGLKRYLHMSALHAGHGASHYLVTKGEAEARIKKAEQEWGVRATIFRPSVIFGTGDGMFTRFAALLRRIP